MQGNEKGELAKSANDDDFELQTLKVLPPQAMKRNIIDLNCNAQCNSGIIYSFFSKLQLSKYKYQLFFKVTLTMPALYPGLDKPSRPIEGYPPVGPPPQLPAANKYKTGLIFTNQG